MGRLHAARATTFCLVVVLLIFSLQLMYEPSRAAQAPRPGFRYSIVPGIFSPSEEGTEAGNYDFIASNLGLIKQTYGSEDDTKGDASQWTLLERHVAALNDGRSPKTQYKVLFLGRHGEGWHNVAESKYGTKEWDAHWSLLEGDDTMHWADALLTPKGEGQALAANAFFAEQLKLGLPAPESYYTSPLTRCLQTCNFTWNGLAVPESRLFRPVTVKELLRETNGEHTCDRRSSVTQLRKTWPESFMSTFAFEPGFSDEDKLWSPTLRETHGETEGRLRAALDDIFEHDPHSWISITSHSGAIRAVQAVIGHRLFPLTQGSMIAVLVKAETA